MYNSTVKLNEKRTFQRTKHQTLLLFIIDRLEVLNKSKNKKRKRTAFFKIFVWIVDFGEEINKNVWEVICRE